MDTLRLARTLALICVVVTAVGIVMILITIFTEWDPTWEFYFRALLHLSELAGVVALALCGATRSDWLSRIGLGIAMVGLVLTSLAEAVSPTSESFADALFSFAPTLTGVGMVLAGIAVLRARRWAGWHRFVPIAVGVYVFVALTPALIVSGGPPATAALWALLGFEVLWLLLGAAVLTSATVTARPQRARVPS